MDRFGSVGAVQRRLNHIVLLVGGWSAVTLGLLILPLPVPLPFPVAGTLLLGGGAMLTGHSRSFRHGVQFARYRYRWLSLSVERLQAYAPQSVRRTLYRTRPDLIERHQRMREGRAML